ncbi:MAG: bifunctional folylpolyglutamate synthase/dihydrofolate synthase [Verrucomicrobiales bacterium]
MDYDEALDWLYGTQLFGMKLGLASVSELLAALGLPGEGVRFVHVAGTNGKGSVCAMSDAILREAGYRVGLFTSPHLVSYRERMVVNGEMLPEKVIAEGLTRIRELVSDWETHPTFFELTLALALLVFEQAGVEVVVLETGMGGRLDATNVVTPDVAVITPVALDHTQWLGETLELVAAEKAGIIKPGVPAVSSLQAEEVARVLEARADECGTDLLVVADAYAGELGLPGRHQRANASLALAALRAGGFDISGGAGERGLARVHWRARFQRVGERLVIDGAHNPAAAETTVATWREIFGGDEATVIFGAVESKDVQGVLDVLGGIAGRWVFTNVSSVRSLQATDLAERVAGEAVVEVDARAALEAVGDDERVLVCGSLFLAGEVLGLIEGGEFEPSAQ